MVRFSIITVNNFKGESSMLEKGFDISAHQSNKFTLLFSALSEAPPFSRICIAKATTLTKTHPTPPMSCDRLKHTPYY